MFYLQLLLEHISGRDQELIDASDRYDNTPLHVAAENGYLSCVKVRFMLHMIVV